MPSHFALYNSYLYQPKGATSPVEYTMMKSTTLSHITVLRDPLNHRRGRIIAGNMVIPCALGQGGMAHNKREGDGVTPIGTHYAVKGFYRSDKMPKPRTAIPMAALRKSDGWCDDPGHRNYNRKVDLPFAARHEKMWREDHLYDIVLDLNWNSRPRTHGRGSAIFLHFARDNFGPTEGCIAIPPRMVRKFLSAIGPRTKIIVGLNSKPVTRR